MEAPDGGAVGGEPGAVEGEAEERALNLVLEGGGEDVGDVVLDFADGEVALRG